MAAPDDPRRVERVKVFQKTRLCKFFIRGKCNRDGQCLFAHGLQELRDPPNLRLTKLCKFRGYGGCRDPRCTFAHSKAELRSRGLEDQHAASKLFSDKNGDMLTHFAEDQRFPGYLTETSRRPKHIVRQQDSGGRESGPRYFPGAAGRSAAEFRRIENVMHPARSCETESRYTVEGSDSMPLMDLFADSSDDAWPVRSHHTDLSNDADLGCRSLPLMKHSFESEEDEAQPVDRGSWSMPLVDFRAASHLRCEGTRAQKLTETSDASGRGTVGVPETFEGIAVFTSFLDKLPGSPNCLGQSAGKPHWKAMHRDTGLIFSNQRTFLRCEAQPIYGPPRRASSAPPEVKRCQGGHLG